MLDVCAELAACAALGIPRHLPAPLLDAWPARQQLRLVQLGRSRQARRCRLTAAPLGKAPTLPPHSSPAGPLPVVLTKARERRCRLAQLLLHLFAAVEDGAVAAGAEHVLVQATLAALALAPQRACGWEGGEAMGGRARGLQGVCADRGASGGGAGCHEQRCQRLWPPS